MENNIWKGYCIDLIEKLANEMNFKYELVVKDKFGELDSITNKWDGLIGGLVEGVSTNVNSNGSELHLGDRTNWFHWSNNTVIPNRKEIPP